ncbi:MAG: hypothetical protein CFE45_03550, partial [Burkholderiales bacterium PBB5]
TALDLHAVAASTVDHGNLVGLVSGYTTGDGASHTMADVWLAKDTAAAPAASTGAAAVAAAGLSLGDLLAGPSAELLHEPAAADASQHSGAPVASAVAGPGTGAAATGWVVKHGQLPDDLNGYDLLI